MKKFYYLMALMFGLVSLTSCSSDDDEKSPVTISFDQAKYAFGSSVGDKVVITAKASAAFEEDVNIMLTFLEGTYDEMEASSEYFHFAKGSTSASITLTRKAVKISGSIMTTFAYPASYIKPGNISTAELVFPGANVYTFATEFDVLADTRSYKVTLETEKGEPFKVAQATEFPIEVMDGSTAVEGVNYEFVGGKVAKFEAGKSEGYVTLKFLKYEEGKELLHLCIDKNAGLSMGNYPYLTISVNGQPDFAGEWQFAGIWKKNAQWWNDSWMVDADALAILIDGTDADGFKIENVEGGYKFTPNFSGKLKNYFTKACTATYQGARDERMQEIAMMNPPVWQLYRFEFSEVNKNISATDSKLAKGLVGFFFDESEDGDPNQLILTIYDYEPTDATVFGYYSWADIYAMMAYSEPVETVMETAPIRIAFKRK